MNTCPVVIVTRNNLALTKKTLKSVTQQNVPVEVLIVDNNSSDGTRAYLNTKDVAVIHTSEQWALAKCWNVALKSLWKAGYDRALVLNNDIELQPVACRLLDLHGGSFVTCVSVDTPEQLTPRSLDEIGDLRATARPHPDFSAFLIRKSVTDKIGWFDESCFPAYTEDSDWHVRMFRAGIQAVCIDLAFLHHGASTLKHADPGEQARIRRGADANRARFEAKYGCLPGTPEYSALFA